MSDEERADPKPALKQTFPFSRKYKRIDCRGVKDDTAPSKNTRVHTVPAVDEKESPSEHDLPSVKLVVVVHGCRPEKRSSESNFRAIFPVGADVHKSGFTTRSLAPRSYCFPSPTQAGSRCSSADFKSPLRICAKHCTCYIIYHNINQAVALNFRIIEEPPPNKQETRQCPTKTLGLK